MRTASTIPAHDHLALYLREDRIEREAEGAKTG